MPCLLGIQGGLWPPSGRLHRTACCCAPAAVRKISKMQQGSVRLVDLDSVFFGTHTARALAIRRPGPHIARQRLCRLWQRHGQQIRAAIFGVGAPEALVVGVVALILFGPKGLAQAVKSLGATFRTVQPTIRELVSASNELRTSLEEQIGLDEIRNEFRTPASSSRPSAPYNPELPSSSNGAAAPSGSSQGAGDSSEHSASNVDRSGDYFGTEFDVDIEAKRREAAQLAWGTATGSDKPVPKDTGSSQHDGTDKPLAALSLAELEAELARRKAAKADSNKGSD